MLQWHQMALVLQWQSVFQASLQWNQKSGSMLHSSFCQRLCKCWQLCWPPCLLFGYGIWVLPKLYNYLWSTNADILKKVLFSFKFWTMVNLLYRWAVPLRLYFAFDLCGMHPMPACTVCRSSRKMNGLHYSLSWLWRSLAQTTKAPLVFLTKQWGRPDWRKRTVLHSWWQMNMTIIVLRLL